MRILGVVLLVLGFLTLAYGGITYTKERKVIDVGPIEATVDERKTIPLSPILGAVALVAGIVLVVAERRRA